MRAQEEGEAIVRFLYSCVGGKMTHLKKQKVSQNKILSSSKDLWDFLNNNAGLDLKNYDSLIVEELCRQLNISSPCKNISRELKQQNISVERFIGGFFKAIQPYARMMSDLCVFFHMHGIKKTNEGMKILFDFGDGPEDLGFNLNHFKEILWKYSKALQSVTVRHWNSKDLWALWSMFNDYHRNKTNGSDADGWLQSYANGVFDGSLPNLPLTGIDGIDSRLQRVWQAWADIVGEIIKQGCATRDDLRRLGALHLEQSRANSEIVPEDDSFESLRRKQELPDFKEWDIGLLDRMDLDRWPESMLMGIFGFAKHLLELPKACRLEKARDMLNRVDELFSSLHVSVGERETLLSDFDELLNLPIWKNRHELYQTWVLTQIDKALVDFDRVIHHCEGNLILRFSGTHIGTIETAIGRVHIWAELRSPLSNPIGKGRKKNIQPDYTLTLEPITSPTQTIVAIECKQYRKANLKNFSNALIDYCNGRPNANIILVNYGEMHNSILENIDSNLRNRSFPIGNFIPDKTKEFGEFNQTIASSLPNPSKKQIISKDQANKIDIDIIAIDISSSMDRVLTEKCIRRIQLLIKNSCAVRLLAIDTSVRKEWPLSENAFGELMMLPRNGGTALLASAPTI